jgi:hypothetical protein
MRSLVVLILLLLSGCFNKPEPKNILSRLTLKLAKPLGLELIKVGRSSSDFNIVAKIKSPETIISAHVTWILVDQNDEQIFKREHLYSDLGQTYDFDSETISLPDADQNYKVVFIFSRSKSHACKPSPIVRTASCLLSKAIVFIGIMASNDSFK